MNDDKGIMKYESTLPADFNGVFLFTNWSDEDFIGTWGGEAYKFSAHKRSPMVMLKYSPLEVQHIRKKFAKDLSEREFFKSDSYRVLANQEGTPGNRTMNSFQHAAAFTLTELAPFIQRCLEPLPIEKAEIGEMETVKMEDKLSRDDDGLLNTEAISKKVSLKDRAAKATGKVSGFSE